MTTTPVWGEARYTTPKLVGGRPVIRLDTPLTNHTAAGNRAKRFLYE